MFGFYISKKEKRYEILMRHNPFVSLVYTFFLLLVLIITGIASYVFVIVRGDFIGGLDFVKRSVFPLRGIDKELSRVIHAGDVVFDAIQNSEFLFPEKKKYIEILFEYIQNDASRLLDSLLKENIATWNIVKGLSKYKNDIYSLLGEEKEQTYLIILQNTSEKRPNGGFFGSFVVVKIYRGKITHFEIMDSYLPAFNRPGTVVRGPKRLLSFLPEREIYFVGANKIGFTYHDGAHIKILYEKSFPGQRVRGVIFVSTDLFQELLGGFREQQRRWQFVNASTDIIRGGEKRGKKELYIESVKQYFVRNYKTLLFNAINKLPDLIEKRYINIYLTNVSGSFHGFLRRMKMTTRFEEDTMYFWESNVSYNKIDNFVDKIIQIFNQSGSLVIETMNDIVDISHLGSGIYTVNVIYTLHVPQYYIDFIQDMEKEYAIHLREREKHILGLDFMRKTRGIIYFPKNIQVWSGYKNNSGIFYSFDTPFSKAISYTIGITGNNNVEILTFSFKK